MSRAYLGDQLGRDRVEEDCVIDFSPEHEEPKLNAWVDVVCDTPDGEELISYMLVDGAYVRDHIFVDYVEGGHYYRYGWIPENQIWLEDVMSVIDQVCTGVHEIHERYRMKYKGMTYDDAHDSACKIERTLRSMIQGKNTIIPMMEDLAKIFEAEGSGEDCADIAKKMMKKENAKAHAADDQANNPEGKSQ